MSIRTVCTVANVIRLRNSKGYAANEVGVQKFGNTLEVAEC